MATLGSNVLTMADWAKRLDPDGKTAKIVQMLGQTNEILSDMMFMEANNATGHRVSVQTGLPDVYWRLMNQGTPTSKQTVMQVDEGMGMLEAWSEVDCKEAELAGNVGEFRLSEAEAFIEAMNQEMASTLFYGSTANPEEFVGFANRYNDLTADIGENILDAGGTGSDNCSIYLIGWGSNSCFGIFPKGSKAGLSHEDLGKVTVETTAGVGGNRMRAYQDHFTWDNGLVLKDWRYGARIANIDVSDLTGLTGTQAITATTSIIKLMAKARGHLPTLQGIKPVFYANRTVLNNLQIIGLEKSSSAVTVQEGLNQFGDTILTTRFLGIPVRLVDALTEAEAQVT